MGIRLDDFNKTWMKLGQLLKELKPKFIPIFKTATTYSGTIVRFFTEGDDEYEITLNFEAYEEHRNDYNVESIEPISAKKNGEDISLELIPDSIKKQIEEIEVNYDEINESKLGKGSFRSDAYYDRTRYRE